MATPWTAEKVEMLRELYPTGLSASVIAKRLGLGSRSAVIAKASRMGLPPRNVKRPERHATERARFYVGPKAIAPGSAINAVPAPSEPSAAPVVHCPEPSGNDPVDGVKFENLQPHHCRWPIGDTHDEDFHFCGCKKEPDIPYCAAHAAKAYNGYSPKRGTIPCYRRQAA